MLGEEKEDHLLGDIDCMNKDEAVQEHDKLVLREEEVLEASLELWGKEDSGAGNTRAAARPSWVQFCSVLPCVCPRAGGCPHLGKR